MFDYDCSIVKVTEVCCAFVQKLDNSVFTQLEGIYLCLDMSIIQRQSFSGKKNPFFWHGFLELLNCDMFQTLTVILWQQNSQVQLNSWAFIIRHNSW